MPGRRPLLLNFDRQNKIQLPEHYQSRIDLINAVPRVDGNGFMWKLPVVGEVPGLLGVLVRPDGFVAWSRPAGAVLDYDQLNTVLQQWFG